MNMCTPGKPVGRKQALPLFSLPHQSFASHSHLELTPEEEAGFIHYKISTEKKKGRSAFPPSPPPPLTYMLQSTVKQSFDQPRHLKSDVVFSFHCFLYNRSFNTGIFQIYLRENRPSILLCMADSLFREFLNLLTSHSLSFGGKS